MNFQKKRLALILCLFLIFSLAVTLAPRDMHVAGAINILSDVPAFDWSYGCSATSAAMLFGYYDRIGYHNMYTGPTNDGVCPLDNSSWGHTDWDSITCGECPLSATHNGIDERAIRGHVDDYWIDYLEPGPDPWVDEWAEHTPQDCTGDYMGTSQWKYLGVYNKDGWTIWYWPENGDPVYDFKIYDSYCRDGCHGMRLFAESRGYTVLTNFSQAIRGAEGTDPDKGFTFADFQAEIDAGRPVIIHVTSHTMLGYGYDTSTNTIYIHDTWNYNKNTMVWGEKYKGRQHKAVTVIQLQSEYKVAAGGDHTVGLKADGTVVAVGWNYSGQCNVTDWEHIVQVAAGEAHTVGLESDGTVVAAGAVGEYDYGQCNVSDWEHIVQVAAGWFHTVGLKSDGTVVAEGWNIHGQLDFDSNWEDIVQVAAGGYHTVGLKSDGTVVAVGAEVYYGYPTDWGQCAVGDWEHIVQVAAGRWHTVGLKSDGTVVAVGRNEYGQLDFDSNWEDIVQVAAGDYHTVGVIKNDGTVIAVGWNDHGQLDFDSNWEDIVHVAASGLHTVGLKNVGTVVAVGLNTSGQCNVDDWMLK